MSEMLELESNQVSNIEVFNFICIYILKELYDSFPVPSGISVYQIIGDLQVLKEPTCEITTYKGPRRAFKKGGFDSLSREPLPLDKDDEDWNRIWEEFPWDFAQSMVEGYLGRPLSAEEMGVYRSTGEAPLNEKDLAELNDFKERQTEFLNNRDSLKRDIEENNAEFEKKKRIYFGTLRFMVSEGFVRLVVLNRRTENGEVRTDEELLDPRFEYHWNFVLTTKAFAHLNIKFEGASIKNSSTMIDCMRGLFNKNTAAEFTQGQVLSQFFQSFIAG